MSRLESHRKICTRLNWASANHSIKAQYNSWDNNRVNDKDLRQTPWKTRLTVIRSNFMVRLHIMTKQSRAASNNYFYFWFICQLCPQLLVWSIKCSLTNSQLLRWWLQDWRHLVYYHIRQRKAAILTTEELEQNYIWHFCLKITQ